jgi:hypothetical protein
MFLCQEYCCILHDNFLIISDDKGLYFLKTCENMDFFLNEKLMYVALDKHNTCQECDILLFNEKLSINFQKCYIKRMKMFYERQDILK